jgi:hypothetical protein
MGGSIEALRIGMDRLGSEGLGWVIPGWMDRLGLIFTGVFICRRLSIYASCNKSFWVGIIIIYDDRCA